MTESMDCLRRELGWAEAKLLLSKVLWQFGIIKAPDETSEIDAVEQKLFYFGFLTKTQFMVQFGTAQRQYSG